MSAAGDLQTTTRTSYVGSGIRRREDPRLLAGDGRFLDDLEFGECFEAAFLRSSQANARIVSIDAAAARKAQGVVAVFTAAELKPILRDLPPKVVHPDLNHQTRYPIATDAVRYVGEPIAVVVATTRYLAEDAAELIEVEYDSRPAVASTAQALAEGAPLVHEGSESNVAVHIVQTAGDPEAELARAPHVLRETIRTTRGGGHSIEGRAVAARLDAATGQLTVWDATQVPHYVRHMLATTYDMTEDEVRVIAPTDIGGGFGPKAQFYGEEILIPWIAMQVGGLVKWVEDRWENFVSSTAERSQTHRVEVGFDDEGKLLVFKDCFEHDQGAYCIGLQVPTITMSTLPGPYKIPNIHSELTACYTNLTPTSSLRGAGRPQAVLVMERMMDRIAEHLGLEVDEVRRRNLIQPDEFPYQVGLRFRDGSPLTYDSGDFPALLDGVVSRVDIPAFRELQAAERRSGRFLGLGMAMYVEGTGIGPYEGARVRLTNGGKILVSLAASPQGQGYETVFAQLAADALELDIDCVEVRHGDTSFLPFGQGTFASRITATAGPALWRASRLLREDLVAAGAGILGVDTSDIEVNGTGVRVRWDRERELTLAQIASVTNVGRHGMAMPRGMPAAIERTAYHQPERATYPSGINAVIVEVDPETGQVAILRSVLGDDCGRPLNPLLVEGQLYGGYSLGVGNALYEEIHYGPDGQPLTISYLDYPLPTAIEVPRPELFHVETLSPLNELGVKGVGESGVIPVPAAIANAVEDALRPFGARITQTPVTPSRVLAAILGDDPGADQD